MAHTAALGRLIQRLHTDTALQNQFRANPSNAVSDFELTDHERDAVVTRDLDDLVAIGAAPSIEALPEVLRGTRAPGPAVGGGPLGIRRRLEGVIRALPIVGRRIPRPQPRPEPRPPGPRPEPRPPGPRPGPDPPGPRPGPDPPGPGPDPRG